MNRGIDRREFLRRGALATAGWYVASSHTQAGATSGVGTQVGAPSLRRAGMPRRVVILGAGLAGLVAGYELRQAGHDVVILEARTRPGGRVHTLREPFSDGLYAEAGAARIPASHHLVLKYVEHFGLELVPFYPDARSNLTFLRGRRYPSPAGAPLGLDRLPLALTPEERRLGLEGIGAKTSALFSRTWEIRSRPAGHPPHSPATTG